MQIRSAPTSTEIVTDGLLNSAYPMIRAAAIFLVAAFAAGCAGISSQPSPDPSIFVRHDAHAQRVDVHVGQDLFTSYLFSDTLSMLKKPVLFPILTADGRAVTRGFPLEATAGERVDHPHHIGLWLNYGDVNGLDFWNNSDAVSEDRRGRMGTIRHRSVRRTESGNTGELEVAADWTAPDGGVLLEERTRFVFRVADGLRIIDRITTLTAADRRVTFDDNKEGMLGLRVARGLEMPAGKPVMVVGPDGRAIESSDNSGVSGQYMNAEGVTGYPDVWGKRARWLALSGEIDGAPVTVAMLDHPENVGYPTYWHARDYGLFAANPLGQAIFSEGREQLGFELGPGASTTFRHRIIVATTDASEADVDAWFDAFTSASLDPAR